jgi:hypothetical protein
MNNEHVWKYLSGRSVRLIGVVGGGGGVGGVRVRPDPEERCPNF